MCDSDSQMYLKKESLSHLIYTFDEMLSIQILLRHDLRHDLFVTIFCYSSAVGYGADIVPLEARSRSAKSSNGTKFKSHKAPFSLSADALQGPSQEQYLHRTRHLNSNALLHYPVIPQGSKISPPQSYPQPSSPESASPALVPPGQQSRL